MLKNLQKYKILLGSKSPRRRELLAELRIPFTTVTAGNIDESYSESIPPIDVPQFLSARKADAFRDLLKDDELLITADTLVICEDKILGKPKSVSDAIEMLTFLSGKTHHVATGVTITSSSRRVSFTSVTDVHFAELGREEIEYYVHNYSPLDKAGAYGIQEWIGCVAIDYIKGSYYNVMGLPIHQLYKELTLF